MLTRLARFGLTGLVTTGIAYVVFIVMLRWWHYLPATAAAWVASVGAGFALNRRFTFGIRGGAQGRQFLLFIAGSVAQLLIAMAGNAVLIGHLALNPSLAFLLNLIVTTSFSFLYLNLVAFRGVRRGRGA